MFAAIVAKVLAWLGGGFLDKLFKHLETQANTETERLRIASVREQALAGTAASVVMTGMQHRVFWVAWAIAAVPTAAWFGWGMVDSLFNGSLPDVAALPPQLKGYADVVMGNIFYAGAVMAGANVVGSAIARRK